MTGWLLEGIEIEGFRGINNEGAPLVIKFKTDKVNSISAPNGVGKSSIFEALTYALSGKIAKLDRLPAAEAGSSYYLNKFHSGNMGTIKLMLAPSTGGNARTVRGDLKKGAITYVEGAGGIAPVTFQYMCFNPVASFQANLPGVESLVYGQVGRTSPNRKPLS